MIIYEIATGYTSVPAKIGAATEIVVEELTKAFINNGIKAKIIDISDSKRAQTSLPIDEVKVPAFINSEDTSLGILHKAKRVVYSVLLAKKLKKLIKNSDEETVLHFHNQYNLFFFFKLTPKKIRQKATIAYTVHSYIWHDDWQTIKNTVKKRYFQEVFAVKNADIVYVLNDNTVTNFTEHLGCDKEKLCMINNGVNTDIYYPFAEDVKSEIKNKLGLSGKTVFLQIGSVCDRKNQLGALELLKPLLCENRNYVYLYAGGIITEEYQNSILAYAKQAGISNQVIYLGELAPGETLNNYYATADLLVFPSKSESFGMVVIESLASGTPVFIRNTEIDFGAGTILYNEDNFEELFNAYIIDKKDLQINEAARENAVNKFSWDIIANDYYSYMQKFIKEN